MSKTQLAADHAVAIFQLLANARRPVDCFILASMEETLLSRWSEIHVVISSTLNDPITAVESNFLCIVYISFTFFFSLQKHKNLHNTISTL